MWGTRPLIEHVHLWELPSIFNVGVPSRKVSIINCIVRR